MNDTQQIVQDLLRESPEYIKKVELQRELANNTLFLMEILIGDDHYLIEGELIDKVTKKLESEPVYDTPDYIHGIVSYEGEVMTHVSITALLSLNENNDLNRKKTCIIMPGKITEYGMAIDVDDIIGIRRISESDVLPLEISVCEKLDDYVKGVVKSDTIYKDKVKMEDEQSLDVLIYLDVKKILTTLIGGSVHRPLPDFYCWRWEQAKEA